MTGFRMWFGGGLIELIENNADAGGNIDEPLGFVLSD